MPGIAARLSYSKLYYVNLNNKNRPNCMLWGHPWGRLTEQLETIILLPVRLKHAGGQAVWEQFKRSSKSSPKDPTVTLSSSGIIGLNTAVAKNIVGDAKYALLFDKQRQLIGLKFIKHSDPDAYPVKLTATRTHGSLAGVSFLKTYRIFPTETTKYEAVYDEREKILTVDLSKRMEARKTTRTKHK